jgi:hypothetical protein
MLPTKRAATGVLGFLLFLSCQVATGAFDTSFHTKSIARRPSVRSKSRSPLTSSSSSDSNAQEIPRGGGPLNGETIPPLPTLRQYRQFALPCLALWVAGPLLSLVDTTFIGLSGPAGQSAQQLAALGPATTFFDGATYLFAFLNGKCNTYCVMSWHVMAVMSCVIAKCTTSRRRGQAEPTLLTLDLS